MKKFTISCLLFSCVTAFAQVTPTFTWNNKVTEAVPGQEFTFDVSYNAGTDNMDPPNDNDFKIVSVQMVEVKNDGEMQETVVFNGKITENNGEQPNAQDNVTFTFTVPEGTPLSSDLDEEHFYSLFVFMRYENTVTAFNFVNDNVDVFTVSETLSTDEFNSRQSFTGFYPNPTNSVLNFDSAVASKNYRVLDMTGRVVKAIQNQQVLNVEDLTAGTYFIQSDNGIGKFVKAN